MTKDEFVNYHTFSKRVSQRTRDRRSAFYDWFVATPKPTVDDARKLFGMSRQSVMTYFYLLRRTK